MLTSGRSKAQNKNPDLQFIINGATESEDSYLSQIEKDSMEVKKIISHLGLACDGNVTGFRRLGKKVNPLNKQKRNCRPILITTSNPLFLQNCFARSHYLQNFIKPVYIKKFLISSERQKEKDVLGKSFIWFIRKEKITKTRIKNLKLYYQGREVEMSSNWLTLANCLLLNCQSNCSLSNRRKLVRIMTTASISINFLTETWLSESICDSEVLPGSHFNVVARSDRSKWEHGGFLIAASNCIQTQIIDFKLPQYPFSVACGLLDSIPSFFILIYKQPVGSLFHFNIELLTDCLNEYLAKIKCLVSNYSPATTVNIYVPGDFNLPRINWETLTSINSQEVKFLDLLDKLHLN